MSTFIAIRGASQEFNTLAREVNDNLEDLEGYSFTSDTVRIKQLIYLLRNLFDAVYVLASDEAQDINEEKRDNE